MANQNENNYIVFGKEYKSQTEVSKALGLVRSTIQRTADRRGTNFVEEAERLYNIKNKSGEPKQDKGKKEVTAKVVKEPVSKAKANSSSTSSYVVFGKEYKSQTEVCKDLGLVRSTVQRTADRLGTTFVEEAEKLYNIKNNTSNKAKPENKKTSVPDKEKKDKQKESSNSSSTASYVVFGKEYKSQTEVSKALGLVRSTIQRTADRLGTTFEEEAEKLYNIKHNISNQPEPKSEPKSEPKPEELVYLLNGVETPLEDILNYFNLKEDTFYEFADVKKYSHQDLIDSLYAKKNKPKEVIEDVLPVGTDVDKDKVNTMLYKIDGIELPLESILKKFNIKKETFKEFAQTKGLSYQELINKLNSLKKTKDKASKSNEVSEALINTLSKFNGDVEFYSKFDKTLNPENPLLAHMQKSYNQLEYYRSLFKVDNLNLLVYPYKNRKLSIHEISNELDIPLADIFQYVRNFEIALEVIDSDFKEYVYAKYSNPLYAVISSLENMSNQSNGDSIVIDGLYPKTPLDMFCVIKFASMPNDGITKFVKVHSFMCNLVGIEKTSVEGLMALQSMFQSKTNIGKVNLQYRGFENIFEALNFYTTNSSSELGVDDFITKYKEIVENLPDNLGLTKLNKLNFALQYIVAEDSSYIVNLDGNVPTSLLENEFSKDNMKFIKDNDYLYEMYRRYFGGVKESFIVNKRAFSSFTSACDHYKVSPTTVKAYATENNLTLNIALIKVVESKVFKEKYKKVVFNYNELTPYQQKILMELKTNNYTLIPKEYKGAVSFVVYKGDKAVDKNLEVFKNMKVTTVVSLLESGFLLKTPKIKGSDNKKPEMVITVNNELLGVLMKYVEVTKNKQ